MSITNKTLINVIYLSLLIMAIGGLGMYIHHESLMLMLPIGFIVFIMTGIYLLLKSGEFIKTSAFRFLGISVALFILGSMFKIMHWPLAGPILFTGIFSFPLIYAYYMIRYKQLAWTNFVKLAFILMMMLGRFFQLSHYPYVEISLFLAVILLIVLLVHFIVTRKAEE